MKESQRQTSVSGRVLACVGLYYFYARAGQPPPPSPQLQAIRHLEQLVDAWEESCAERDLDALHAATEGLVPRYGIAYSAHAFELSLILDIAEVDSPCAADALAYRQALSKLAEAWASIYDWALALPPCDTDADDCSSVLRDQGSVQLPVEQNRICWNLTQCTRRMPCTVPSQRPGFATCQPMRR